MKFCAVGNHCHSAYCYNCHAFLCFGVIPDLEITMRYDETRDRNCKWLTEDMKKVMHQSLAMNNLEYNQRKKNEVNEENARAERSLYETPLDYLSQVLIQMKELPKANNYVVVQARHDAKMMYEELPKELVWLYNDMPEEKCTNGKQIIVRTLNEANKQAEGNEIWIVGAFVDDVWYAAEVIFDNNWNKKMRMLGWNSYTMEGIPDNVWGILPKGEKVILVLEKNRWRGKCEITYLDESFIVDTYGDDDNALCFIEL